MGTGMKGWVGRKDGDRDERMGGTEGWGREGKDG
ncbi:hypothetical protein Pcinc_037128, partial [Petrolisthes cinctipes]